MPALTRNFSKLGLSLSYDALTIYSNFSLTKSDIMVVYAECKRMEMPIDVISDEYIARGESYKEIRALAGFERPIHEKDPDHTLYHQDTFNRSKMHAHLKFKNRIKLKELEQLIDIFVNHKLLTQEEKQQFFDAYKTRYKELQEKLDAKLSNTFDAKQDTTIILNFIQSCIDNDLLAHLHTYLLETHFDYLRHLTPEVNSTSQISPSACNTKKEEPDEITVIGQEIRWQGTNAKGELVETSKQWATIEKAITLQIMHNIKEQSKFNKSVTAPRLNQLESDLTFFKAKRKFSKMSKEPSKTFQAFAEADPEKIDGKRRKVFTSSSPH